MKKTLIKAERLHKKKLIQELFSKGSYFYLPPFKVYGLFHYEATTNQFLIAVPKKAFKLAVTRNKIKRRIREAYRLNKSQLSSTNLLIGYIYIGKDALSFNEIQKALKKTFPKLDKLVNEKS